MNRDEYKKRAHMSALFYIYMYQKGFLNERLGL